MRSLAQLFCDFANWSTVCGVPHIANAQTKLSRAFWALVFICLIGVFGYQLFTMIIKFFKFPVKVTTDIFFEEQLFPVVTVCNYNPYKYSVIDNDKRRYEGISKLMEIYEKAVKNELRSSNPDIYNLTAVQSDPYKRDSLARDALAILAAKLPQNDKNQLLYSYNDLISECSFAGTKCTRNDFTQIIDPVYGACYSFNAQSNQNFSVQRAGMKFGLKLLLTISQYPKTNVKTDFLSTTQLAGARISVHARGSHPALESHGMNIGVGYQTAVSVTMAKTQRHKRPYGRCVDRESETSDLFKDYTYTLETCFTGCRQRYTEERCQCSNPRYDTPSTTLCDTANLHCLQTLKGDQSNVNEKNLNPLRDCGCEPPCHEINYFTTTSLAKFPASKYNVATDSNYTAPSCDNMASPWRTKSDECRSWYSNNALLLQVFFETLKYEKYTETPSYGISDIINDLGGQAGLWLGLSVISIVEVTGLLILLLCYCVTCGGIRVRPSEFEYDADDRIKDIKEVAKEIDSREQYEENLRKRIVSEKMVNPEMMNSNST